jgi:hypothetical protein
MTERGEQIAALFVQIEDNLAELGRLQSGRLQRFLTLRQQKRLLVETDALLERMADLTGSQHVSPLRLLRRNPVLIGRPQFWIALQWVVGIYNAFQMIAALSSQRYWLAALNLVGMVACTQWRLPPWRLARRGKYNDDEETS